MLSLYLASDALTGRKPDVEMAADFLELSAFSSIDGEINIPSEITNIIDVSAEEEHYHEEVEDDSEIEDGSVIDESDTLHDEIEDDKNSKVDHIVDHLEKRLYSLKETSYPFRLDADGNTITYIGTTPISNPYAAYILSLVLSHLKSGLITNPEIMSEEEVRKLREYFQYFATAALAAEVRGDAWSFGFPRTDGTSFLRKLRLIWEEFQDGRVDPQIGAPESPKDDQVDVFAARLHPDKLPGFLLAAAQVTTTMKFKNKPLKGHLSPFKKRWFGAQPVTDFIPYMIIPFMRSESQFFDDVRVCGNVLHRLRVPRLVEEAGKMGHRIEDYEELERAAAWLLEFRARCLAEEQ